MNDTRLIISMMFVCLSFLNNNIFNSLGLLLIGIMWGIVYWFQSCSELKIDKQERDYLESQIERRLNS